MPHSAAELVLPQVHRHGASRQIRSVLGGVLLAYFGSLATTLLIVQVVLNWQVPLGDSPAAARPLLQTVSPWSGFDLAFRLWWCALAGFFVMAGPRQYQGTRLMAVGWLMGWAFLGEAAVAPLGATAALTTPLLWLTMMATFGGGCLQFLRK